MLIPRSALTRRLATALDATPSRIPVLLGPSGSGRTTVLTQLRDRIGRTAAQYVDVERTATTPERFFRSLTAPSPFPAREGAPATARAAFVATMDFLSRARPDGATEPATFLLDEFLEFRTFESFPGLRQVLGELLDGLASSGNRFVLASRYSARTVRLLGSRSPRFEIIEMPPLSTEDVLDILGHAGSGRRPSDGPHEAEYTARAVHALTDGRPVYARAVADELQTMRDHGGGADAISALAALFGPEGRLSKECCFCYELRLHRARGYGALKAILEILADEEGLTLTEISQRLQRTPGSTKDYLSWLEDVDLVTARQKRYCFTDPLLRVWVRLHCRVSAPGDDDVAREIHRYALPRLPHAEPALALAGAGITSDEEKKAWGIIEID